MTNRETIYKFVKNNPGCSFAQVGKANLAISNESIGNILFRLRADELIKASKVKGESMKYSATEKPFFGKHTSSPKSKDVKVDWQYFYEELAKKYPETAEMLRRERIA